MASLPSLIDFGEDDNEDLSFSSWNKPSSLAQGSSAFQDILSRSKPCPPSSSLFEFETSSHNGSRESISPQSALDLLSSSPPSQSKGFDLDDTLHPEIPRSPFPSADSDLLGMHAAEVATFTITEQPPSSCDDPFEPHWKAGSSASDENSESQSDSRSFGRYDTHMNLPESELFRNDSGSGLSWPSIDKFRGDVSVKLEPLMDHNVSAGEFQGEGSGAESADLQYTVAFTSGQRREEIDSGKDEMWPVFSNLQFNSMGEAVYKTQENSSDLGIPMNHGCRSANETVHQTQITSQQGFNQRHQSLQTKEPVNIRSPSLKEFVGAGGGQGIFRTPAREPIRLGRPASLELRPRPLRETQIGQGLKTIICTGKQLWAGLESGVRVWEIKDVYINTDSGGRLRGDEDTAMFRMSVHTSPTVCLFPDAASKMVWSGHKDGKIRAWATDVSIDKDKFEAILTWQAHPTSVLSMVVTSYGELWTGSESGAVRAWPWEAAERALTLSVEENPMAALLMERSYIDLRSRGTAVGTCTLPNIDVRFLLSDHSTARVWSGGFFSLVLWDARTRDVLKVFGTNAQAEFCSTDILPVRDSLLEDEIKIYSAKVVKKEKTQGTMNFFQRSKNVLMGAADAVRRVTGGGQFGDDSRKLEALAASSDQMIWAGYANGLLVQWDCKGNRIQEFQNASVSVQCLCGFGTRIWVGYADGRVQIMEQDGKLLGGWIAHSSAVVDMAVGSGYVFTLSVHGGIRGWNMASPSPLDGILRSALIHRQLSYTRQEHLKILAGTWNVSQERASCGSLISWLAFPASEASIVAIGLQEMEMGAGVLAMAAAKETVGIEGSANGQWWLDTIGKILDEGVTFERAGSRQLAGLLVAVWVRKDLRPYIGEVDAGAVACGFGRALGNKGAVALKMRVFRRTICVINCHFAAHMDAVARRNADFEHVYRNMTFGRTASGVSVVAGVSSAVQRFRGGTVRRGPDMEAGQIERDLSSLPAIGAAPDEVMPELAEADMLIWLGDFNYRLVDISYDEARDHIAHKCFDTLLEKDQLRGEMKAGRVFQGMREGHIKFPPTYKFDRGQVGLQGYDSSEKKRVPAWCDRILFRDSCNGTSSPCKLTGPVFASVVWYDACMDITDSDHKPVRCVFNVDVACIDERIRRSEFGDIMHSNKQIKALVEEFNSIPGTVVSTNNVVLQDYESSILRITNESGQIKAIFEVLCEGEAFVNSGQSNDISIRSCSARSCFGFSRWLQVTPSSGVIGPGQTVEICIHHEDFHTEEAYIDGTPQNWWCEAQRDKVVILVINVRGSASSESRQHRIRVCHCISSGGCSPLKDENENVNAQTNILQRSDFHPSDLSSNPLPDLLCFD